MSQVASERLVAALDGTGLYDEERNVELWERVPEELRLVEFSHLTLPDHPAFRWRTEGPATWRRVDLGGLPEPMRREFAYCFWQVIESGMRVTINYSQLVGWLLKLGEDERAAGRIPMRSLLDRPLRTWERDLVKTRARRTGKLGWTSNGPATLRRCYRHLAVAYDPREWWQHDIWSPKFDARIPMRTKEPNRASSGYDFLGIAQPWLREGAKWHLKIALETGLLRWGTLRGRLGSLEILGRFIADRGVEGPELCADPTELRLLALDFLAAVRQRRATAGPNRGERVGDATVRNILADVEQFYAWMADHRVEAARALGEPCWERLGDQHARLWREGEKPRRGSWGPDEDVYFDETTMAQLMRHADVLGAPRSEGGLDDEQAMRIMMLLARTGRRVSELLLLDFDCLLPIVGLAAGEEAEAEEGAIVARLRFAQTKIEGAPDTIFVDGEVVAIVRAQQQWAHDRLRTLQRDEEAPPLRHLFLAVANNNLGRHPYPRTTFRGRMSDLGELADIRDGQGRRPPLGNVHRFRHTRATNLINSGVPVHVVQRYLGHLSPRMTMHYAKTLRETHEHEFLRHRKITADGSDLGVDPRDLFALLELDRRTDRVLPNGLCMLPPRQACDRGNACLTCDKFATDASHLPEHEGQLAKLEELIAQRQAAFRARTGEAMTSSNVWLEQRLTEQRALGRIIGALNDHRLAEEPGQAVRGAGTGARAAAQPVDEESR